MLHHRYDPAVVKKAYACAAVAKMEGVNFFYFSYQGVDFEKQTIEGWSYKNGDWKKQTFGFPNVIINISGPKTTSQKEIYRNLKKIIPFTSHSVGNKMRVYKKIRKAGEFAQYLIPTVSLKKTDRVYNFLNNHQKIVIKPFSGHHGENVLFVERLAEDAFKLIDGEKNEFINLEELGLLFEELKNEQKYLVQPFIECKTKAGLPYDFRMHVQKSGMDLWEITLIYPRISGSGKYISNVSGGGYRGELVPFLKTEFGDEFYNIKRLLEHFAITFTTHLETLYKKNFDELGIDVGIDENRKLWVFEVNWRPGSKHREFEVAKRLIKYAEFLANRP